jgi:ATP-binding cassette subfamily F protein 3
VKIGYYAQNPAEMLDPDLTVFDTIDRVAVGEIRTKIRTMLGGFLFGEDEIDKKVKVLSGGEKARLALAKLLLTPANLLVLDEPTNHLDMMSKDILKNALLHYEGTLILVSHDRDFLQGLTNKVYEFRDRQIKEYLGDIYDFLESRRIRSLKELEVNRGKEPGNTEAGPKDNKQLYEVRKQLERDLRKLITQVEKCEQEIASLEESLKNLSEKLNNPESLAKGEDINGIYVQYTALKDTIDGKVALWESLNNDLEKLQDEKTRLN